MLSAALKQRLTEQLRQKLNAPVSILDVRSVGGGCINDTYLLQTNQGDYFLKVNQKERAHMFRVEKLGLQLLQSAGVIRIPEIVGDGNTAEHAFLLLEYIPSGSINEPLWAAFGNSLARLHRVHQKQFGLDHDNYIGSLEQYNDERERWVDFFIENRLAVQLKRAVDFGLLDGFHQQAFNKLYTLLEAEFPEEEPSLLHGDLWSGNFMVHEDGEVVLIDPAVYFGHREADLAFTQLFGRFDEAFYRAYEEEFPLEEGFSRRKDLYNLYPLLVHVNLFGRSYVPSVELILRKWV